MHLSTRWFVAALLAVSFLLGCSRNLLQKAHQFESEGNNASALLTYQQVLSRIPEKKTHERSLILLRIGECLYRMERYPEAFSNFQKAVDIDPANSGARLRLGELLLAAGASERAREQAMVVLNSSTHQSTDALALLGAAWMASDHLALAKSVYQQVLSNDPKRVKVSVALADIYNREGDPEKAREVLKRSAAAQPQSALPWLAIARLEEQEGNGEQAEDAYRRAVTAEDTPETNLRLAQFLQRGARIAEAEQVLRRVDAQRQKHPVALADFQLASGHAGQAMEHYRTALEAASPLPARRHFWQRSALSITSADSPSRATIAARIIEAAITAADQQQGSQRAASLASVRTRLDSFRPILDQATMSVLEAELALADNNLIVAQVFSKNAVDIAPNSAAAHYVNGLVESGLGNRENATKEWQSALDSDANYMPAHLALGQEAIQRGDAAQADEHARTVVRDDPGNINALILFARALLLQDKPTLAAVMATRAQALDPSAPEPAVLAGEIALKMNRVDNALFAFQRAVAAHPDSEEAMDGLLRVYRYGSVSYASLEKMEKIALQPPVSATLLEIAGRLYADHGWYREAIRALNKAVEIDPHRITAARVLAHLQVTTGDYAQANKTATQTSAAHEPLLRAYQAEQGGNWKQATADYERALREGDQTGVAANNLAWIYASQNQQLDRALHLAQAAVKAAPEEPGVLDTLGFVYLQRREYSAAVGVLETAARLGSSSKNPETRESSALIRKHLSEAYYRSGQTSAAAQIAQNVGPFALK